jgi:hypothetical protein
MTIRGKIAYPEWFGRNCFHAAHRSNLLRKDPVYYGKFGWQEKPDMPYLWGQNICSRIRRSPGMPGLKTQVFRYDLPIPSL